MLLGIVFSAIAFYFFVRGIKHPDRLFAALRSTSIPHVLGAVILANLTFLFRGLRWQIFLDRHVKIWRLVATAVIGFAANNLLPARAGEIIRGIYLSKKEDVPVATSLGSPLAERVFDVLMFTGAGIFPVLFLGDAMLSRPMPGSLPLMEAVTVYRASVFALVVFLIGLCITLSLIWCTGFFKRMTGFALRWLPERVQNTVNKHLANLLSAFEQIRPPRKFAMAVLYSCCILFSYMGAFSLLCRAYQPGFPLSGSIFAMIIIAIGVGIPSAPGYVGVMWLFTQTALMVLAFPDGAAEAVAIQYWAVGYFPITIAGIVIYMRDQALLSKIAREQESS